jgi:hypothetical protein
MANFMVLTENSVAISDLWPATSGGTIASVPIASATIFEVTLSTGVTLRYSGTGMTFAGDPPLPTGGTYGQVEVLDDTGTSSPR